MRKILYVENKNSSKFKKDILVYNFFLIRKEFLYVLAFTDEYYWILLLSLDFKKSTLQCIYNIIKLSYEMPFLLKVTILKLSIMRKKVQLYCFFL